MSLVAVIGAFTAMLPPYRLIGPATVMAVFDVMLAVLPDLPMVRPLKLLP